MDSLIKLRPISLVDEPFLYQVYSSTREEEMAQVNWTSSQKDAFLEMQFKAQKFHYEKYYHDAEYLIIVYEGKDVGRLYVLRLPREIRIVDIAILPEARNKRIGTRLLNDLLEEGRIKGLPVSIHVEHYNPALNLYKRLGFGIVNDNGVYYLMEWAPP